MRALWISLRPGHAAWLSVALLGLLAWFARVHWKALHRDALRAAQDTLTAVADLKVAQIRSWRRERLADATVIAGTPYAVRRAMDCLRDPDSETTRKMFTGWLDRLLDGGTYGRAILVDGESRVRLVYPEGVSSELDAGVSEAVERAKTSFRVTTVDLPSHRGGAPEYLSLVVPLIVRRERGRDNVPAASLTLSPDDRVVAVLVLQIPTAQFLVPVIRFWPTISESAETLLVHHHGYKGAILGAPPRDDGGLPMLGSGVTRTVGDGQESPEAMALRGVRGPVAGYTAGGVPVLAVIRAIDGSPWTLVTQIHRSEALRASRWTAVQTVAGILLVLIASAAVMGLIWRQQALRRSRQELESHKSMEAALRRSEEQFRRAVLDAPFPILIHAENGEILQVSDSWCEITGYSREELRTIADWTERAYGERRDNVRADIDGLCTLKHRKHEGDYLVRTREGEQRTWDFSSAPLGRLSDGRRLVISMALDVTERRGTEAALRESEARYRLVLENSLEAILLTTPGGGILEANPAACEMFGWTADELRRLERGRVVDANDPRLVAALEERERTGRFTGELTLRRRDGTSFPAEISSTIYRDREGRPRTSMIVRDVTERKRMEEARADLAKRLLQQQRLEAMGTLAGGVAHEINNPINGIMNYAQILQDRLEIGSPLREFTGEIIHETERVTRIVRSLLAFARTEQPTYGPARISDIVEETLSLVRAVIRQDQIDLRVDLQPDLPEVRCQSTQIQQVVMNLVTNARDALNERYPGHHPDKCLAIIASRIQHEGATWIRVAVEDQGTGIAPDVRERMFDPFFTTKPLDRGTGLGLSISRGIAKEHGARLNFESEPGRFTRALLDLPPYHHEH